MVAISIPTAGPLGQVVQNIEVMSANKAGPNNRSASAAQLAKLDTPHLERIARDAESTRDFATQQRALEELSDRSLNPWTNSYCRKNWKSGTSLEHSAAAGNTLQMLANSGI